MDWSRYRTALIWLLLATPAIAGISFSVFIGQNEINDLYELVIKPNALSSIVGITISALLLSAITLRQWHRNKQTTLATQLQDDADSNRRSFLRRLDHELKNPLTALHFSMSNLENGDDAPTAIKSVNAQVERLTTLTNDIRKLANLDTIQLDIEEVDLAELLDEIVELVADHPNASQRRISLSLPQAPWPIPKVFADKDLIFLAIYNLVENAIKYTDPNDNIEIRAREDSQQVIIEIADTGPGIDEADIGQVWEDLYRGKRTQSISGSGLGLSLVKAVAERHSGSVALTSRAGQGSVFSILIPIKHDVTKV